MPHRKLFVCLIFLGISCAPPLHDLDLQGHRGARGLLPENSIAGFIKALELGMTTLEMDVVVSQDSQLVVSHEPWMSHHICSHPDGTPVTEPEEAGLRLFQMTYTEIQTFDCGQRGNPRFPTQTPQPMHKPLLRTVIDTVEATLSARNLPLVGYNIETKSRPSGDHTDHPGPEAFAALLYHALQEADMLERVIVQSFDVRTLQAMRWLDDGVPLALLIGEAGVLEDQLAALGFVPEIYSPYHALVDADLVAAVRTKGMRLIPWTVNEPEAMERLHTLGVDGLITDYPDRAQFLLE